MYMQQYEWKDCKTDSVSFWRKSGKRKIWRSKDTELKQRTPIETKKIEIFQKENSKK